MVCFMPVCYSCLLFDFNVFVTHFFICCIIFVGSSLIEFVSLKWADHHEFEGLVPTTNYLLSAVFRHHTLKLISVFGYEFIPLPIALFACRSSLRLKIWLRY